MANFFINGKTGELVFFRNCPKWRKHVYKRDGRECQICKTGIKGKKKLSAHHLLPYNKYPEYRKNVNNGVCLCFSCHSKLEAGLRRKDSHWMKINTYFALTIFYKIKNAFLF